MPACSRQGRSSFEKTNDRHEYRRRTLPCRIVSFTNDVPSASSAVSERNWSHGCLVIRQGVDNEIFVMVHPGVLGDVKSYDNDECEFTVGRQCCHYHPSYSCSCSAEVPFLLARSVDLASRQLARVSRHAAL